MATYLKGRRCLVGLCGILLLASCSEDGLPVATDGEVPSDRDVDRGVNPDTGSACTVFPADNQWNTDISGNKVHQASASIIASIGADKSLHPDFGTVYNGAPNGIPYVLVPGGQALAPIVYTDYGDESDPGPFPIPQDAPVEGGAAGTDDRHVIAVDMSGCVLYELFNAWPQGKGKGWKASSGARFDLRSNKLRKIGWTSADAAGLPIYPGLVRHAEVATGTIGHALRFTVQKSRQAYVLPATHWASSSTDPSHPPMGLRLRLKASIDISGYSKSNQVILKALQTYGMFVADNGSDWFLSGAPNPKWDDDDLHQLKKIKGKDFEVVDTGPIRTSY